MITDPRDCSKATLLVWRDWLKERIAASGNAKLETLLRDIEAAIPDAPGYTIDYRRD